MCLSRHNENLLVWQKLPPMYIKMNNTDIKSKNFSYVAVIADLNHFRVYAYMSGSQILEFVGHYTEANVREGSEALLNLFQVKFHGVPSLSYPLTK